MKQQKLSTSELSSLCMELYLILQAGIPLAEGMEMVVEGTHSPQLTAVARSLQEGNPLYQGLEQSQAFPQYMIDMVRVGEATGNLDRSLRGLSAYYSRQQQLEQTLRRGVLYPAVLLVMLSLVLVVLVVEVLPMFNDVYAQLGGTLSGMGGVMLTLGTVLKTHWAAALLALLLVVVGLGALVVRSQRRGDRVLLSQKLGLAVATAKLASALAMALQSGLDTDTAMELAQELTQHPQLHQKLGVCRLQMEAGDSLASALRAQAVFAPLHCRMLAVGIRTGATDEVMEDIARRCDTSAQEAIDRYISGVEPTLVMVMSILVGIVLLSVMLPLAGIMSALG